MDEFIQGVKEVWNNHYMLILFIVLDVVYAVVGKISVKKNKENADYYFGKNVEKRSNPLREETSVSDVILMIIICTPIIIFIFVIIYAIFAIEEVRTVCEGVLLYINEFPGIMITTYITLVTFLGIFIKWDNKKFIVCELDQVVEEYGVYRNLKKMLLLVVGAYIFLILGGILSKEKVICYYIIESIVLTSFIVYMKQFVNIIWFILDLLFGSTTEKRILDILYQIYQNTEIRPTRGKIDLHILENQINYLLDEHIKYAKKVNKKQTDKISFDTNIRLKNDKSNRFKILKRRSLIICSLFNGIFIALYEYENGWKLAIAIVAIYCVVLCFVTYICPELATVFVKILYGKRGYEIVLDKRIMNKRYVSEYGICKKGVWYKYINSIKNIVAFAEIVEKTNDRDILYQMIGHIQERCKEDEKLEIVLIIMDYRWNWKKKKNIDVGLREVDKEKYGEFAKAFITDINLENFKRKNTPGQADVLDLSDINKYLQWEQKKNYIRKSLKDKVYALIENVKHKVLLFFI